MLDWAFAGVRQVVRTGNASPGQDYLQRGSAMRVLATVVAATVVVAACGGTERDGADPAIRALQLQLLERGSRDQAIRDSVFLPGGAIDSAAMIRMGQVDRENTEWLKAEVAARGWPTRAGVGAQASEAAFLIVQHATHDAPFQQAMLDTLTRAWEAREVDGESYALLYDRVQSQAGRKQRYGTQARFERGAIVFEPIEDSARVDSLRASVGLGSLSDYRRVLDSVYRRSPATTR